MNFEAKHDSENQKFYAKIDGKEAYLRYLIIDGNTMDMIKTYVPPELRGKGIAGIVVKAGMIYAKENNFKIIPTCSYVETFIERHKEFKDLVAEQ